MVSTAPTWVCFTFPNYFAHGITGDSELKVTKQMQIFYFFQNSSLFICVAFKKMLDIKFRYPTEITTEISEMSWLHHLIHV